MSLTVFLALCILGLDFIIYAFFQWIYGDKRRALARQLLDCKIALKEHSPRPFLGASEKAAIGFQEAPRGRIVKSEPRDTRPRASYRNDSP
jgi:hypothetical protein